MSHGTVLIFSGFDALGFVPQNTSTVLHGKQMDPFMQRKF